MNTIKVKITKFKRKSLLHGFPLPFVQEFSLTFAYFISKAAERAVIQQFTYFQSKKLILVFEKV